VEGYLIRINWVGFIKDSISLNMALRIERKVSENKENEDKGLWKGSALTLTKGKVSSEWK
jgi:hypothetical protein